jgi:hypothetical protein
MERFTWSLTFTLGDTIFECGEEEGGKCGGVAENRDEVTPTPSNVDAHFLRKQNLTLCCLLPFPSFIDLPFPLATPGRELIKQYRIHIRALTLLHNWVDVRLSRRSKCSF